MRTLTLIVVLAACAQQQGAITQTIDPPATLGYVPIKPCRLADTRADSGFSGDFGAPALASGGDATGTDQVGRVFPFAGQCGIPLNAEVVSANLTVTNTTGPGFLSVWPAGEDAPHPLVSSLNYVMGATVANAVLAPLGADGGLVVFAQSGTDIVIDVDGYFVAN